MSRLSVSGAIDGLLSAAGRITTSLRLITASRDNIYWDGEKKSARVLVGEVFGICTLLNKLQDYTNSEGTRSDVEDSMRFVMLEHVVIAIVSTIMTFADIDAIVSNLNVQLNGGFDITAWEASQDRLHAIMYDHITQQRSCLKLISNLIDGWWVFCPYFMISI